MSTTTNYARNRRTGEYLFIADGEQLPLEIRQNARDWVVYDLSERDWRLPVHRIGEDGDARFARVHHVPGYDRPLLPVQGIPSTVQSPFRRLGRQLEET